LWEKVADIDLVDALVSKVKEDRVKEIDIERKKNTGRDGQADRDKLLAFDVRADELRAERDILTEV